MGAVTLVFLNSSLASAYVIFSLYNNSLVKKAEGIYLFTITFFNNSSNPPSPWLNFLVSTVTEKDPFLIPDNTNTEPII